MWLPSNANISLISPRFWSTDENQIRSGATLPSCCLSYTVNTMSADALATLGARLSAHMVLTCRAGIFSSIIMQCQFHWFWTKIILPFSYFRVTSYWTSMWSLVTSGASNWARFSLIQPRRSTAVSVSIRSAQPWGQHDMERISALLALVATPHQEWPNNENHWWFLWCWSEQAVEQTVYSPVVWNVSMLIWSHCNEGIVNFICGGLAHSCLFFSQCKSQIQWARYGVSLMRILKKIDHVITAPHYNSLMLICLSSYVLSVRKLLQTSNII